MENKKVWFTLIEILVVVAILWLLAIWFSQTNYKAISERQMANIFTNKIITILETVRNNSLLWRGKYDDSLSFFSGTGTIEIPFLWTIEIPFSSWSIVTNYETYTWSIIDNDLSFSLNKWEEISRITCKTFWSSPTSDDINSTGTIVFEKEKMYITWCPDANAKILQIRTKYKNFGRTITINTINGVIETSTN